MTVLHLAAWARSEPAPAVADHIDEFTKRVVIPSDDSSARLIRSECFDAMLIAVADGDQTVFADLCDQLVPHVFAVMTLLGAEPDPVEATRHAMIEIWRTAPRYAPSEGSARAWCLNIAYRQAIGSHRTGEQRRNESTVSILGRSRTDTSTRR